MPSKVDLSRLAHATRVAASLRAYDATMSYAPTAAQTGRDFAVVARVMTDLINEIGNPDIELQRELQQLSLQTENVRTPMLSQLSDGNHTMDLQPLRVDADEAEVVNVASE